MSGLVPEILMYRFIYIYIYAQGLFIVFLEVTMTGSQSKSSTIIF